MHNINSINLKEKDKFDNDGNYNKTLRRSARIKSKPSKYGRTITKPVWDHEDESELIVSDSDDIELAQDDI